MPDLSPIRAVTHPDPYPYYATLAAERPFGYDEALCMWVAADAGHVAAVLGEPVLRVRPPAEPVPAGIAGTAAGQVFGHLVRMTDGPPAQRLKNIVVTALGHARPERIAEITAERTARMLKEQATIPLHELMFTVPAQIVAVLCGLDEDGDERGEPADRRLRAVHPGHGHGGASGDRRAGRRRAAGTARAGADRQRRRPARRAGPRGCPR